MKLIAAFVIVLAVTGSLGALYYLESTDRRVIFGTIGVVSGCNPSPLDYQMDALYQTWRKKVLAMGREAPANAREQALSTPTLLKCSDLGKDGV